jgi:hypothetical protein
MREMSPVELRTLVSDLEVELDRMKRLEQEIQQVQSEIHHDSERANL